MKKWYWVIVAVLGLGAIVVACDDMPVIKKNLPDASTKVAIPDFENKTSEPGIDTTLTQKVVQNFLIDGRLQVTPKEKADELLQGTVERYDQLVMTRDQNQVPQQYKLVLAVDLTLTDLKTGNQMWTTHTIVNLTPGESADQNAFDSTNTTTLREFTTYYVLNVVGVPPEDEPTALNRLLDQMASRVVRRTIDGF
jgi:hypothetical protein